MAKNFPYFKFIVSEWMLGDIVFESLSAQGLFINICALYWQKDGKISVEDIKKRYKNPPELSELLGKFIAENDGILSISFMDEQLHEANHTSVKNSKNGSKGGRPKAQQTLGEKPTALISESQTEAKKSNIEEEKKRKEEEEGKDIPPFYPPTDLKPVKESSIADWNNTKFTYEDANEEFKKLYTEKEFNSWRKFNVWINENCPFIRDRENQIKIFEFQKINNGIIENKHTLKQVQAALIDLNDSKTTMEKYNSVYGGFTRFLATVVKNDK